MRLKETKKIVVRMLNLVGLTVVLFSCDKENTCVKTSGNTTTENRSISQAVDIIELDNKINLILRQDSVVSLQVEAGANLLPLITTEISGNQLTIKSDNKCSFLRDYKKAINVYLSLPNLKKIIYKGHGNITSANTLIFPNLEIESDKGTGSINIVLVADYLKILEHTGPADFTFTGSSQNTYLYTNGNGWFHFENFSSDYAQVNTSGTGDVLVKANISLLVELYAIGNVYYYGNPTLTVSQHTGSGEIKKR